MKIFLICFLLSFIKEKSFNTLKLIFQLDILSFLFLIINFILWFISFFIQFKIQKLKTLLFSNALYINNSFNAQKINYIIHIVFYLLLKSFLTKIKLHKIRKYKLFLWQMYLISKYLLFIKNNLNI